MSHRRILDKLNQLIEAQPTLHTLHWDTSLSNEGNHRITINSSEPYEVKSVDVIFSDPDEAVKLRFYRMFGAGYHKIESFISDPAFHYWHINLFDEFKINIPPSLEANRPLQIEFIVTFENALGFNGNERFSVRVLLESPRRAVTELKVETL